MSTKRSNNAIWKLVVPDGVLPKDRIKAVIRAYAEQVTEESGKRRLIAVPLNQLVPDVQLDLYVRRSFSLGLLPFVEGYLAQAGDAENSISMVRTPASSWRPNHPSSPSRRAPPTT
jgi:hypothetical protein